MLFNELAEFIPEALNIGLDEPYDTTSVPGYTFYGVALLGTTDDSPNWWIMCSRNNVDGSVAKTRYYPPNQRWSNRANLALP